jgi:polysaccharide deacetylase family protein (PEP-CTERM system associated)
MNAAAGNAGFHNILTVDVEDWPQSTLDPRLPISEQALTNTNHLLDIMAGFGAKGTFFVQTLVAEKFPELIRRIAAEGHEIASHGHNHIPLFKVKKTGFAADLKQSLEILGKLSPQPVLGYRAPDFSLRQDTLWALEILRDQGIQYSSSIFPFRGRRYGIMGSPHQPHQILDGLIEVPLSVVRFAGRDWPVAGGGYLRLYPYPLTRWAMRRINGEGRPVILYLHPYELDPQEIKQFKGKIPPSLYWSQGLNRVKTESKLRLIFQEFHFVSIREGIKL